MGLVIPADITAATQTPNSGDDEEFHVYNLGSLQTLDLENDATQSWSKGHIHSGIKIGGGDLAINPDTDTIINGSTDTITISSGSVFTLINLDGADEWSCTVFPLGQLGALALLDTVGTTEIDDDAVTYAKIQNVSATDRVLGRDTAGAGVIEEIAPAAMLTMLGLNDEDIEDVAGALVATGGTKTGITVTYQDGSDDMDFVVAALNSLTVPDGNVDMNLHMFTDLNGIEWEFTNPSGTSFTPAVNTNQIMIADATGNATINAPTGEAASGKISSLLLFIRQDGTGSRTITMNAVFIPAGAVAPTFSTGPGDVDIVQAVTFDGGVEWFYWLVGNFLS